MGFKTLDELYKSCISSYASNPAFSFYAGESITYGEFAERVEAVVEMLVDAGLSSGDKVALLSSNMPNWNVCYFAAVTAGMTIIPILPDFSPSELDMIIEHSDAKALMVSDKPYVKISKEVIDKLDIVIRTKNLLPISRRPDQPRGVVTTPKEDDIAAIIYTSGTTSQPKGVMLSHRNLCAQMEMLYELYPIGTEDTFLSILPLSHTYECSVGMLYPFSAGAHVVYLDKAPTATALVAALKDVRPTLMLSVPLVIEKLYKNQVAAKFKKGMLKWIYSLSFGRKLIHRMAGKKLIKTFGSKIRFFGVGGARLDAVTERFLAEAKFPFAIGYGLTETAPLIAGALPFNVKPQSTGPALKGIKVRLEKVNEEGDGELVVLSPCTMVGYYKNPEATKEVFTKDGWFRTKDLAAIDDQGHIYIKGRLNNMIIGPSGENIYPEEIESVINGYFLVSDSIVRQEKGKLVALVRFNKDEMEHKYNLLKEELGYKMDEIKSELISYVNSKVNKFSKISMVEEQTSDFEKTPTHKIRRFKYTKNK